MTTITTSPAPAVTDVRTRPLLTCAAVAAPLWASVSLVQAFTRDGFDITRHPLSQLSTGGLGWLQITNFVLCGALTVAGGLGLRRSLASAWAPRLIIVNGMGMVSAGIFRMDPADGYPVGTPDGVPTTMSWHSTLHMVSGTIAFAALIAACFVLGRMYSRAGNRRLAIVSRVAGTVALAGTLWCFTGGAVGSLTLAAGIITAMLWTARVAATAR
jgi:hypothetical protein